MIEGKYFKGNRRSEIQEMREELQMSSKDRRKDAIKRIIGAMTTGKDVSSLFPDVVNCIQTNNIELKKLVYLYVINYAKVQPELAILAVNTFCKDARDRNPLIRALAIRTMGYIRLSAITEYLVEPLKHCQTDVDPYVRKTAATCIAKLYAICPSLVVEEGFLDILERLLSDSNPMVVANAVSTLVEISEISDDNIFSALINNRSKNLVTVLINSLNGCTEWGQIYILDALIHYKPVDSADARRLIDLILPRFSHINPAVVMSAMKVVLKLILTKITDKDEIKQLQTKLVAPLVTLASLEPEIQYVALRSILVVVAKWPRLLEDHVSAFFCKSKDPLYVRIEKLDIIVKLATTSNYQKIISELKEYATDVDLDFVRRDIRSIGMLAIRLESSLSSCINVLNDLLNLKIAHLTEECTIVFRDLLRAYPQVFTLEMFSQCADVEYLLATEAKAALIWIVGQYANVIPEAAEYILNIAESFHDENYSVQLALLTAAIKIILQCETANDLVLDILQHHGIESPNPDVRDRSSLYLRLLDCGHNVARKVVLAPLPRIGEHCMDKDIVEDLLYNLGHVSTVYHLPSWAVAFKDVNLHKVLDSSDSGITPLIQQDDEDDLFSEYKQYKSDIGVSKFNLDDNEGDDDDDDDGTSGTDIFRYSCPEEVVLHASQKGTNGQTGIELKTLLYREDDRIFLRMILTNKTSAMITLQAIQFNLNPFGLSPTSPLENMVYIAPDKSSECTLQLLANVILSNKPPVLPLMLQAAIKTNVDVFYFKIGYELPIVLVHDAMIDKHQFLTFYMSIKPTIEGKIMRLHRDQLIKSMSRLGLHSVGNIPELNIGTDNICFYAETTNSLHVLVAISGGNFVIKSDAAALIPSIQKTLEKELQLLLNL